MQTKPAVLHVKRIKNIMLILLLVQHSFHVPKIAPFICQPVSLCYFQHGHWNEMVHVGLHYYHNAKRAKALENVSQLRLELRPVIIRAVVRFMFPQPFAPSFPASLIEFWWFRFGTESHHA